MTLLWAGESKGLGWNRDMTGKASAFHGLAGAWGGKGQRGWALDQLVESCQLLGGGGLRENRQGSQVEE